MPDVFWWHRHRRVRTGGIHVGGDEIAAFTGTEPSVRPAAVLDGVSEVVGPVLNDESRQLHEEFD